jgi:hypothetical protein
MANALFKLGKEGFLLGEIDFDTAVIKAALVRGYTPNTTTHKFMSDVTGAGGTIVATASAALASKTGSLGVADCADFVFSAVAASAACEHIIIYQSSAVGGGADVAAGSQRVIAIYDSGGLPVTPNGNDINVTVNASGLFEI